MKIILKWCVWFRWKELELAKLEPNKTNDKPESAVSRWARAGTKAAKVGKGLLKDDKAQKLALRHWLEAVSLGFYLFYFNVYIFL